MDKPGPSDDLNTEDELKEINDEYWLEENEKSYQVSKNDESKWNESSNEESEDGKSIADNSENIEKEDEEYFDDEWETSSKSENLRWLEPEDLSYEVIDDKTKKDMYVQVEIDGWTDLKDQINHMEAERKKHEEKVKVLNSENIRLVDIVKVHNAAKVSNEEDIKLLQEKIAALESDKTNKESFVAEKQSLEDNLKSEKSSNIELKGTIKKLEEQLSVGTLRTKDLQEKIEKLETQIIDQSEQIKQANLAKETWEKSAEDIGKISEELKTENNNLKSQYKDLASNKDLLAEEMAKNIAQTTSIEKLIDECSILKETLGEKEKEIKEKMKRETKLQAKLDTAEKDNKVNQSKTKSKVQKLKNN